MPGNKMRNVTSAYQVVDGHFAAVISYPRAAGLGPFSDSQRLIKPSFFGDSPHIEVTAATNLLATWSEGLAQT